MNEDIIRFENVTVCYGRVPAVHHVSARVPCGSTLALVGPNGAGKSTLLRAIMGWNPCTTGRILVGDDHTHHQLPRFAYLAQRKMIDWDFPATVRQVVEMGRFAVTGAYRRFTDEDHRHVDAALEELQLRGLSQRQIGQLSGGQQQRVFLARAVAQGADIFLFDEPFEGLDRSTRDHLIEVFAAWRAQHRTVIAAVHDIDLVRAHFTHALLLKTHLVASGPVDGCLSEGHLQEAYGTGAAT